MLNRIRKHLIVILSALLFVIPAMADEQITDEYSNEAYLQEMDKVGADSVAEYDVTGTVFQRIVDMEQEKMLMQLEKERTQLELDLERLTAERMKLNIEMGTLSGRADKQAEDIENEKQKLEAERASLEQQKRKIAEAKTAPVDDTAMSDDNLQSQDIESKYKLVEIVGAGRQLQATLEDLSNGQNKKIWTGKKIDGYDIKSISLDEGVVFSKDGQIEVLNMGGEK